MAILCWRWLRQYPTGVGSLLYTSMVVPRSPESSYVKSLTHQMAFTSIPHKFRFLVLLDTTEERMFKWVKIAKSVFEIKGPDLSHLSSSQSLPLRKLNIAVLTIFTQNSHPDLNSWLVGTLHYPSHEI
ncbi:hypothetical protein TURU_066416 [Turdus rufiventris]|nr:hypothetical protein TURU_066416 [Turdus rufiventris]